MHTYILDNFEFSSKKFQTAFKSQEVSPLDNRFEYFYRTYTVEIGQLHIQLIRQDIWRYGNQNRLKVFTQFGVYSQVTFIYIALYTDCVKATSIYHNTVCQATIMMFKRTKSSENYQNQRGSTIGHQRITCFRCLRSWVDSILSIGQAVQES